MYSCLKLGSFSRFYILKYFVDKSDKEYIFHLRNGLQIKVIKKAGDLTTLFEIFVNEDYQFNKINKKNIKILDIGANVGYFSLYTSQKFPDSEIFSFEPFPETYERLQENLKLNNSVNIKTFQLAVSDFEGPAEFYSIDWAGCNTLVKDKFSEGFYKTTTVKTIPFKGISKLTGIEEFDYAKIDCEGSEYPIILNSPASAIRIVKKYVFEVHSDTNYGGDDLIKRLIELGYKTNFKDNILTAERID